MQKLPYILPLLLSLSIPTYATTTVVPNGITLTTTVTLADDGDSALIEEGGAIEVVGGDGVSMENDNQTAINQGRILIQPTGVTVVGIANKGGINATIKNNGQIVVIGNEGRGVTNVGSNGMIENTGQISLLGESVQGMMNNVGGVNSVLINHGLVSATGETVLGIYNLADNSQVINSGRIFVTGGQSFGLENDGENVMISNSGLISATGDLVLGIANFTGNSQVINSGRILVTGDDSYGIENDGDNVMVTNSGLVSSTGDGAFAIYNFGGDAVIANSGQVLAVGSNADGVFNDEGSNIHLINSGTIKSATAFALNIDGTNPTLSLLKGSNLQGPVQTVTDPFNLNVETGLNLALTLDSGGAGFAALGIEAPFVLLGQTISVIDPTGLAMQADVVADLSDTILDGIYRHRAAFPCSCLPSGCGIWAQGIGSNRERGQDHNHVGYDNWQGGFLLGYDTYLCGGNFGLFGGVSLGEADVDQQTQQAEIASYVAGLTYERIFCNSFLGLACAVGYVDWENERFVMNNLAPGGVEKACFETEGFFISPELTLAHRLMSVWCRPALSFTLRYAGLFLGDYAEHGSLTNLAVKNREIDLLTTRFEFALPYSLSRGSCCGSIEPYLGVFGRYQVGGKYVDAELLGQSLNFDPGSPHNLAALLVGFRGVQSFKSLNLSLNLEASFDNCSSARILGEGGIGLSF